MSTWSRLTNLLRRRRLADEVDEELADHLAEALERGRDPLEARRALGSPLRQREASLDQRLVGWLDALRADAIFGWRQVAKNPATSAVAILSLALAIGACTAAFRLIDALLLRPLPIAAPERLYSVSFEAQGRDGRSGLFDSCSYPLFSRLRDAARGRAELLAVSYAERTDLTYGADREIEQAYRQLVSGWTFDTLGVQPALGRVLHERDDRTPGAHPVAVISYDYWQRRFAGDPQVVGRTFRMGGHVYEIVGVLARGFTGTEPGTFVDIFAPTMMEPDIERADTNWLRTLVRIEPGVAPEPLREVLHAAFAVVQAERLNGGRNLPPAFVQRLMSQQLRLFPASTGVSGMQRTYGRALSLLAVLVALVLLIACATVANLMTARAGARAREMALRVSIGAGRGRLVQLLLVESAWLATLASLLGALFAWQAAPAVVGLINPPDDPARLALPADWRVLAFGVALAFVVTSLFGLMPAWRASAAAPSRALRAGADPLARRRTMYALVTLQAAFCSVVTLIGGVFTSSHQRLANEPTGFSLDRLLVLSVVSDTPLPAERWRQAAEAVRATPGVERLSLADRPLLSGQGTNSFIAIDGQLAGETLANFRRVAPGWLETMRIPLRAGRDFRTSESHAVAIVNERFVQTWFAGVNPLGRSFARGVGQPPIEIVGVAGDARYRNMRDPMSPVAYVLFADPAEGGDIPPRTFAAFIVRTATADPLAMGPTLRRRVLDAGGEIRVNDVRTQAALVRMHTVRERLLALLSSFFAGVAWLLAGVGLFGVLHYSVLQRRREIAIRMALGAPPRGIAWRVAAAMIGATAAGALAGVTVGVLLAAEAEALTYHVKPTDPVILALPAAALALVVLVASLVPVLRAVRIDPCRTLRAD
jgi:putative ABC transport system permease protein